MTLFASTRIVRWRPRRNLSATNRYFFEFIVVDKAKARRAGGEGVGVLKDEELKLEEIEASHTVIR